MNVADLPLFAEPGRRHAAPPAAPGSATSEAAAVRVTPHVHTMRAEILGLLKARGRFGATRQEISDTLGMKLQTVCARVGDLMDLRVGKPGPGPNALILPTDRRREKREVLVAREHAND